MMGLDGILARAVDGRGRVDYGTIDDEALAQTLDAIATAELQSMSRDDRYAFLLNAYNAWGLRLAGGLPRSGLRSPWRWFRFFVASRVVVAGRRMSLLRLEFGLLRPHLRRDPRGHFALVCASAGCPPLRGGAYRGACLDEDLDAAARAFLRPGVGYRRDEGQGVVHVTRILKWYRRDFARLGGTHAVLARYGDPADAKWLLERPRVRFMQYDWRRNDAEAA